jgi:hypothetical protein
VIKSTLSLLPDIATSFLCETEKSKRPKASEIREEI